MTNQEAIKLSTSYHTRELNFFEKIKLKFFLKKVHRTIKKDAKAGDFFSLFAVYSSNERIALKIKDILKSEGFDVSYKDNTKHNDNIFIISW